MFLPQLTVLCLVGLTGIRLAFKAIQFPTTFAGQYLFSKSSARKNLEAILISSDLYLVTDSCDDAVTSQGKATAL